jgi:predicted GIY-YIG superfamily endonuclease
MAARQLEHSGGAQAAASNGATAAAAEQQEEQQLSDAVEPAAAAQGAARRSRAARTAAASSPTVEAAIAASQWTLEAAAAALQEVAQGALAQGTSEEAAAAAQQQDVLYVRRGQQPGPATVGCSCVYVLRRPDGYFYAGSTEAIGDRLKSHRQRTGKGGPHMEMAFLSLGSSQGAASLARSVESAVIRELQRRGFPMLSATDARRRHVARASGVAASAGDN